MRRRRPAVVLAVVLLLAGCTAVPTDGPVQIAVPVTRPDVPALVSVPDPPEPGADPQAIVEGFVQAASAGGDYSVAKQFLTTGFAKRWDPDARVVVHDQSWTTVKRSDERVELDVPQVASVSRRGVYSAAARPRILPFTLVQQRGQWRISSTENGVVLARLGFLSVFDPVTLGFFDPAFSRAVPDPRWFPSAQRTGGGTEEEQRTARARRVLQALVAGQAPPLRGSVSRTAFPEGTRLGSVAVSSGVVAVEVTVPGAGPDARTTERMQQQIARSLPVLPAAVRLLVNGRIAPVARPLRPVSPDLTPSVVSGSVFGALDERGVAADPALGKRIVAERPDALTVSRRQRFAALRTGRGPVVRVTSAGTKPVDSRPGLVAPTVDQRGWIYSVPADDPTGLTATPAAGAARRLPVPLGGSSVLAIEASPDGTRMLVLVENATGPAEAYVAGIERGPDGAPVGLTSARYPVSIGAAGATAATWVDDAQVAVLTTASDGGQDVTVQQLGGIASSLGRLPSRVSAIAGGGDLEHFRVLTADTGDLYTSRDDQWQREFLRSVRISVLAVQR